MSCHLKHHFIIDFYLNIFAFSVFQDDQLQDLVTSGVWPPKVGEHLALHDSSKGPIICEFLEFLPEEHKDVSLRVRMFQKYFLNMPNNLSLWQDNDSDEYVVTKSQILPVRPQIELVPSLSRQTRSGRKMVFQVENMEVISSFTSLSDSS